MNESATPSSLLPHLLSVAPSEDLAKVLLPQEPVWWTLPTIHGLFWSFLVLNSACFDSYPTWYSQLCKKLEKNRQVVLSPF